MNLLLKNYVAVEGKDNALEMASVLLKNDYQVFVQHDDCDIYIVAYTDNNNDYDTDKFALLDDDELELVQDHRYDKGSKAAIDRVKDLIREGFVTAEDLDLHK